MKAGTPMGTGANNGQVVTGVATCCPPIVLDRVERLVILSRRRGWSWQRCRRELLRRGREVSTAAMYEALRKDWCVSRIGSGTRERILAALESVLTEEER